MARTFVRLALALPVIGGLAAAPGIAGAAPAVRPGVEALPFAVTAVANWRCPYCNVDPRYDAGNNTGDAMVERLNQQQLNRLNSGGYYAHPRRFRPPPPPYYGPRY